jgi:TonB family protein
MRVHIHLAAAVLSLTWLVLTAESQTQDPRPRLNDEYEGKTFLLRGFYSGDGLLYDAQGALIGRGDSGDWTTDGFVTVDSVYASGPQIVVESRRLLIVYTDHKFQFKPTQEPGHSKKEKHPVRLKMTVDFGNEIPSDEKAEAALSRIFLTAQDDFSDLVPEFWKPCISGGRSGKDGNCAFSPDVLVVPGVAALGETPPVTDLPDQISPVFRVGNGVSPPRPIYKPDPDFSESARQVKFQGTSTLSLVVNQNGVPTNIRIVQPLGSGLDAKAVQAVKEWRFDPAHKEDRPVAAQIMVEILFHLY